MRLVGKILGDLRSKSILNSNTYDLNKTKVFYVLLVYTNLLWEIELKNMMQKIFSIESYEESIVLPDAFV